MSKNSDQSTAVKIGMIVLKIVGCCCFAIAALFAIASIMLFVDNDFGPGIIGLVLVGGSATMGYQFFNFGKKRAERLAGDDKIISQTTRTVIPLSDPPLPAQTPEETQSLARNVPAPATSATTTNRSPLDSLLTLSNDVFASLKDLVRHDSNEASDSLSVVAADALLSATDLLNWETTKSSARVLSRTNMVWIAEEGDPQPDMYDKVSTAELALNLARDIGEKGTANIEAEALREQAKDILFDSLNIEFAKWDPAGDIQIAYPNPELRITSGEWVARMTPIRFLEDFPFRLRMTYDLDSNVREHTTGIKLGAHGPQTFSCVSASDAEAIALAKSWMLRSAVRVAEHAFTDTIERVAIDVEDYADKQTLMHFDLGRKELQELKNFCTANPAVSGTLPQSCAFFQASVAEDGWLQSLQIENNPISYSLSPSSRFRLPELDTNPAPPAVAEFFHVKRVADIGINENAARVSAFAELNEAIESGKVEQVVSKLVAVRDSAPDDISLVEAADRVSQRLVDGTIDASDADAIRAAFVDGTVLDEAYRKASALFDEAETEEKPFPAEEALEICEKALATHDSVGAYLDNASTVYRYFGSAAERLRFNRTLNDQTREVKLVPDAYFNTHSICVRLLTMMERYEEAETHLEVLKRIAPASIPVGLQEVRLLENQSRTFEATDVLKQMIYLAYTPADLGMCYYRLAYMEWKLGREDLAAACYVHSMRYQYDLREQAEIELNDLLSSHDDLSRPSFEDAEAALEAAQIPLGLTQEDCEMLLAAGIITCDANLFSVARSYLGTCFDVTHNDAIIGVYRSLAPFD